MNKNIKNIIIIVVIIILAVVGYLLLFGNTKNNQSESSLTVSSSSVSSKNIDEQISNDTAFLTTLLGLNGIKIDSQLFFSKTFSSLSDNTVDIVNNGSIGRVNPFAPFEVSEVSSDLNTSIQPVTTTTINTEKTTSPTKTSTSTLNKNN